jgi:hypothetical protein
MVRLSGREQLTISYGDITGDIPSVVSATLKANWLFFIPSLDIKDWKSL